MLKRPSSARRAQIKMLKMPLAGSTTENVCGIKMKNAWDAQQPNIIVGLFNKKFVSR
jgi:hypothetical protein